jgi:uncharacterized protein
MTPIGRPIPKPDLDSAPYWEAASRHELKLQQCNSCARFRFYPRSICPYCFSTEFEWRQLSGRGIIYSFTVIHRAAFPAFETKVPYVLALVELNEGVRMMSNILDCDPNAVEIGMPVEVTFEDLSEEVSLPQFRLSDRGLE